MAYITEKMHMQIVTVLIPMCGIILFGAYLVLIC